MFDLNYLKNVYSVWGSVREGDIKFKKKMAKNLMAIESLVDELRADLQPIPEYVEYQEKLKHANANEIISLRERYKSAIKKQQKKNELVAKKYSHYAIDLEEFEEKEIPDGVTVEFFKTLMQFDLIKHKKSKKNKEKDK